MPTQDKTERDFVASDRVTLKEFLLGVMNERERKYEVRFASIDKGITDIHGNTKDALASAYAATKDALGVANGSIAAALASIDKRFDAVNEFRAQLADQEEGFVRKVDVESAIAAFEKAILKSEAQVEKRLDSVNEFRAQMADQQATLVRKTEVDYRFEALEKKLDTAVSQLQLTEGRKGGMSTVWGVLAVVAGLVIEIGVVVAMFAARGHP